MASGLHSLPFLLFVSAACSQIIGLGDIEKTDEDDSTDAPEAGTDSGGKDTGGTAGRPSGGGTPQGGTGAQPSGGSAGAGGASATLAGAGGTTTEGGAGGAQPAGAGGTSAGSSGEGGSGGSLGGLGGGGTGGGCATRELLVDGNFDLGSSAWKIGPTSTDGSQPIQATPYLLTMPNAAWLGHLNAPGESEYYEIDLYQAVTIPENAVKLEGTCRARMRTAETIDEAYDEAYLFLSDMTTAALLPIVILDVIDNLSEAGVWFDFGSVVTAAEIEENALAGTEVAFNLYSANDYEAPTDFFVDNCSLVATVCE